MRGSGFTTLARSCRRVLASELSTNQQFTALSFPLCLPGWQDCLPWESDTPDYYYGGYQYPDDYYCADTCAPGSCPEGQECELVLTPCAGPDVPCPPVAVCGDGGGDPCDGACDENQARHICRCLLCCVGYTAVMPVEPIPLYSWRIFNLNGHGGWRQPVGRFYHSAWDSVYGSVPSYWLR